MGRLDRTIRVAVWVLAMGGPTVACGWGRIGHDAVAYIAECNLSPKAQRIAEKYLGHSIVYFSSWMDDYRRSPGYEHTTYWHMAPVDERMYYTDEVRSSRGDAVCELENAIGLLKNYRQLDDSTVAANLRYVIHLVGDMHCPAHVDYPGVELWYDVSFNGKKRSYHSVWDSGIIEASRKWHYVEWQQQLDRCTRRQNARSWPARRATGSTRRRSSAATFMRWLLRGASSGAILSMPLLPVSNVRFSGPDIVWPKC